MKSPLFVSDPVMTPKAYQLETEMNGALSMACQRAAPYVAAARATSTKRLYGRAFKRWATWCEAMHANPLPASPEGLLVHLTGTKVSAKRRPLPSRAAQINYVPLLRSSATWPGRASRTDRYSAPSAIGAVAEPSARCDERAPHP